jgi:hypothetical protein
MEDDSDNEHNSTDVGAHWQGDADGSDASDNEEYVEEDVDAAYERTKALGDTDRQV